MDILQPKYSIYALAVVLLCTFLVYGSSIFYELPPSEVEFKGVYRRDLEDSTFLPCGASEKWWANAYETPGEGYSLRVRYDSLITEKNEYIFLVVKGSISELGKHGHLGMWDRTLNITQIINASTEFPHDCIPPKKRP